MATRALGWEPPTLAQQVRALRGSHPEAGDSVLADIVAAKSADNSALTCNLDQLTIGSCQSNGPAQAMFMSMKAAGIPAFVLSRLWLYYSIRYLEGTVDQDAGGNIGDAYTILAAKGVPSEEVYPYDVSKFTQWPGPTPDRAAYDSRGKIGVQYHPISSTGDAFISDMEKASTAKFGIPFGCQVTNEFCSTQPNGIIHTPKPTDRLAGGHCMTIVGFDDASEVAVIKNSWGREWQDPNAPEGCCLFGYDYLMDMVYGARDSWINLAVPQGLSQ
jgi:C1A family cysteine protease